MGFLSSIGNAFSGVGDFLDDVGTAAIGAGSSAAGAFLGQSFAKQNAKLQYQYNRQLYQNRYQWQMADMAQAGLNPILSYKTGAGSPGGSSLPSTSVPDLGSSARQNVRQKSEIEQIKASTVNTKADSRLKEEQRLLTVQQELKAQMDKMKALEEVGTAKALRDLRKQKLTEWRNTAIALLADKSIRSRGRLNAYGKIGRL